MRESIGGTMLFWIVLFFFSIFIVFIAFIIKYARVYKIKNTMINYIERNEGVVSQSDFEFQLKKMGYQSNGQYKICRYLPTDVGGYYYLELYSTSEFPVVGNWLSINVTIKGETRMIETGTRVRSTEPGGSSNNSWFFSTTDQCKVCTLSDGETRACDEVDA